MLMSSSQIDIHSVKSQLCLASYDLTIEMLRFLLESPPSPKGHIYSKNSHLLSSGFISAEISNQKFKNFHIHLKALICLEQCALEFP